MSWIKALKVFNKDKNEWCVPKKGTEGYTKSINLMNEDKNKKNENKEKVKAGSILSNIIKARLIEDKHLKKVVKGECLAEDYYRGLKENPRPRADKEKREKETTKAKNEYKKLFNIELDTSDENISKNKRLGAQRYDEHLYREKTNRWNSYLDKDTKKKYTVADIRKNYPIKNNG